MKAARNARILLAVFIASASLVSVLEAGHQFLHTFKNPFHNHGNVVTRKGSGSPDLQHTLEQHGFRKVKFDTRLMERDESVNNFILIAFGFFDAQENYCFSSNSSDLLHNTRLESFLNPVHSSPPTPPPSQLA